MFLISSLWTFWDYLDIDAVLQYRTHTYKLVDSTCFCNSYDVLRPIQVLTNSRDCVACHNVTALQYLVQIVEHIFLSCGTSSDYEFRGVPDTQISLSGRTATDGHFQVYLWPPRSLFSHSSSHRTNDYLLSIWWPVWLQETIQHYGKAKLTHLASKLVSLRHSLDVDKFGPKTPRGPRRTLSLASYGLLHGGRRCNVDAPSKMV